MDPHPQPPTNQDSDVEAVAPLLERRHTELVINGGWRPTRR